ncbi:MgsA AAA+ ATPase C terminal [Nesidiocoris tenuis]|uniref:MgsA AAA+ ATPase C terminal n=1 Tax=Nesidiocoris tenuis TaxID=355587 RepID=A0ABN7ABL6_9HEMI|nr:MgsA AAA+ ATPase C terminal [Nesidiocoris tenuis]
MDTAPSFSPKGRSAAEVAKISCPICSKCYNESDIQSHVDKCIFLNSSGNEANGSSTVETPMKRPASGASTSPESSPLPAKIRRESSNRDVNSTTSGSKGKANDSKPLAEMMRPNSLGDYVGQEHLLGDNLVLRNLLEKDKPPSMILWGPPGCGKTTLAHIIHQRCSAKSGTRFVKLSATLAGINDVKEAVKVAQNEQNLTRRRTILFMDEIHRFNKLQQDVFLPHVESGLITLIGATTENPSFSLNNALLSRCRVFVLEKLKTEHVVEILMKALAAVGAVVGNGSSIPTTGKAKYVVDSECVKWLAEMCDGDARIALNSLQIALESSLRSESPSIMCPKTITLDDIKEGIKRSHMLYDRKGEEHYNIISALHKSIRASDENASLYWLARMLEGGEDPIFIARRLVRASSEDIGLADPMALTMALSAMQACQLVGMPECDVFLAQTAVYLARAPKSREMDVALGKAKSLIKSYPGPQPSVPLHLRNAPTRLMKDLGYSKGYNMRHKDVSGLSYLPEGLEGTNFFDGN